MAVVGSLTIDIFFVHQFSFHENFIRIGERTTAIASEPFSVPNPVLQAY